MNLQELRKAIKIKAKRKNSFAGFQYFNLDDLIEEVEKQLKDGSHILFDNSLEKKGDNVFVKSTVYLMSKEKLEGKASGYAAIDFGKAKMDASQKTGSAITYAQKYALKTLLFISSEKDPDENNTDYKKDVRNLTR